MKWLSQKYKRKRDRRQGGETLEEWAQRMAEASGPNRSKIQVSVPVYGDVMLDLDETDALKLPPKYAIMQQVKIEMVQLQGGICKEKARWFRKQRVYNEKGDDITEPEESKTMDEQIAEEGFREIYDPKLGILDFRKLRPTDIKNNPRAKLCKSRPPREEAELETR